MSTFASLFCKKDAALGILLGLSWPRIIDLQHLRDCVLEGRRCCHRPRLFTNLDQLTKFLFFSDRLRQQFSLTPQRGRAILAKPITVWQGIPTRDAAQFDNGSKPRQTVLYSTLGELQQWPWTLVCSSVPYWPCYFRLAQQSSTRSIADAVSPPL